MDTSQATPTLATAQVREVLYRGLTWSDAKKTLTIGARSGTFPGMLQSRTFNVVFVAAGHGVGATASKRAMPDWYISPTQI